MSEPAKFRMKLVPEGDFMHPQETAENFDESTYFNVFDPARRIGEWFRLAKDSVNISIGLWTVNLQV